MGNAPLTYGMKKIFFYHLITFLGGAVALAAYFFLKAQALRGAAGLAVVALLPVAIVYIIAFGIFCAISCAIWVSIFHSRKRSS
ncbi:MAG: hypothetical protein G01um101449_92 [Parcubacteria group bacterium Gr01-1014_49]|nr:MAG: hypothetical protein G01um101449_92 [Parcubacteria group bacterium Gr01-1014_49]